jgi:REP element-mobilizing transposase RayT
VVSHRQRRAELSPRRDTSERTQRVESHPIAAFGSRCERIGPIGSYRIAAISIGSSRSDRIAPQRARETVEAQDLRDTSRFDFDVDFVFASNRSKGVITRNPPRDHREVSPIYLIRTHARHSSMSDRCALVPNQMAGELSTRNQGKATRGDVHVTAERKPRGGKRPNAGRKRSREFRYDPSHAARPALSFKHPVHAMLRTLPHMPRLRQRAAYEAIRTALVHFLDGEDFRVVHVSIQANHLHLIVEAIDKRALRRGMQRLAIRAARALNEAFGLAGKVFAFRYQAKQIKTASYARNAIAYVLNNWRRHGEDRRRDMMSMPIDWFSSAVSFTGWSQHMQYDPPDPLPVSQPRTRLLQFDWQWHGLIDPFEVPGALDVASRH